MHDEIVSGGSWTVGEQHFFRFWAEAYQEEYDPDSLDDQQIKRAFMQGAKQQRREAARVLDIFHQDWADDPRCNECTYELLDSLSGHYIGRLKCL